MARGDYKCAICKNIFKRGEVQKDHIEPVTPVTTTRKAQSLTSFVDRCLVYANGWQILCKPCHKEKTLAENRLRKGK